MISYNTSPISPKLETKDKKIIINSLKQASKHLTNKKECNETSPRASLCTSGRNRPCR